MGDTAKDPVDHARTNCQFTGEAMKDIRFIPGLVLCALGVGALAVGIHLFAIGHAGEGLLAAVVALVAAAAGVTWMLAEHHRIVHRNQQWMAEHPHR
jgi:hypothetical protein